MTTKLDTAVASSKGSTSGWMRPGVLEYGTSYHHAEVADLESHVHREGDILAHEDISEESALLGLSHFPSSSSIVTFWSIPSSIPLQLSSTLVKIVVAVSVLSYAVVMLTSNGFHAESASDLMYKATHLMGIGEKQIDAAEDRYLPSSCPGLLLTPGVSDPRDMVINGAEIAGVGNHGFEVAQAAIFTTGQYNQHSVNWILATKAQGEGFSEFHMAMVEITSEDNKVLACVLEAGLVEVPPDMKLDDSNIHHAWASRKYQDISICDTCPGLGVKNVVTTATDLGYDKQESQFQVPDYIPFACPGDNEGYAASLLNITVDLIDSYAGLAYLGGNNIIGKTGLAHEAIIFFNRYLYDEHPANDTISEIPLVNNNDDLFENLTSPSQLQIIANNTNATGIPKDQIPIIGHSYIVAYVDLSANMVPMVEVQLRVNHNGHVTMCSPTAKTYSGDPEAHLNATTIHEYWESADPMNVASCRSCAGYGVTMMKFKTVEPIEATPEPTVAPLAAPSAVPTPEPTYIPTMKPTKLDVERGNYYAEDIADGKVDGVRMVVFVPQASPTEAPIIEPTFAPIPDPTFYPLSAPTAEPSFRPSSFGPTHEPSLLGPSPDPTMEPTIKPTREPVSPPTLFPIGTPTTEPITAPTPAPTLEPTDLSHIKLGRPCDTYHDDYVDQGGLTFNGTAIFQNAEDSDIGTTNNVSGIPPTPEPSAAPTVMPSTGPGEPSAEPTINPTVEPTVEPTEIPGTPTDEPTATPAIDGSGNGGEGGGGGGPPTAPPTPYQTHGATVEPCIDEYWVYAPSHTPNAMMLDTSKLKPCDKSNIPNFDSKMKMVARLPPRVSTSSKTKHVPNVNSNNTDTSRNNIKNAKSVTKKKDVTQMDVKERRAFYLSHFATPEQRKKALDTQTAVSKLFNAQEDYLKTTDNDKPTQSKRFRVVHKSK